MENSVAGPLPTSGTAQANTAPPDRRALWLFVIVVTALGGAALAEAIHALPAALQSGWTWITALALLTILTGGIKIKVPAQPATVSVSEFFVFVLVLAFGAAPATIAVALDGLWSSLSQKTRRLDRVLFNVAEPALGAWCAGHVYVALSGPTPVAASGATETASLVAVLGMTLTFFASNSALASVAVGLETGAPAFQCWKRHGFYLALNYYAAAALAMLAVESGMRASVLALIAPLLVLSYVAYRAVASRAEESAKHLHDVERLYQATIETLAIAVDAKDEVTHDHVRRVQRNTVAVARALGVADPIEIKAIEAAALLHDVGKLAVPDYVLNKPGALTLSEFEKIKLHTTAGAAILSVVEFPYPVVPIVRSHHEQWNGKGYPDGLVGEQIPIGARVLTVVDCFDALTSDRPYRRRMSDEEAMNILRSRSGTMYDPRVVEAFIALAPDLRREDAADKHPASESMADMLRTNASIGDGRAMTETETVTLPEMASVAPAAFAQIRRQLPGAEVCLLAQRAGADSLTPAYATPLVRHALANRTLRLGDGVSGWVAAHRYRIVNSDPALDLGEAAEALNLRSCMSVPVFALGDLIAILSVYLPQPRGFGDREARVVGKTAQDIAIGVVQSDSAFERVAPARPVGAGVARAAPGQG